MKTAIWHVAGITLATGVVFFVNLGVPALWDEDEPLYAAIAWDMYERGDLIVPRYNGELFAEKPPLAYWLMMLGYWMFEDRELAARFWSAVFGVGTAWITYLFGRRLFNPAVGFWAALATGSNLIFTVSARAATTDSVFVFFTTLALYSFVVSGMVRFRAEPSFAPGSWPALALMYVCLSMTILAKGPIGLILPVGMLGFFLLVRHQWESSDSWWSSRREGLLKRFPRAQEDDFLRPSWQVKTLGAMLWSWVIGLLALGRTFRPSRLIRTLWQLRPITALVLCGIVACPWYILVGLHTDGEFLRKFFWEQNVLRTMQPMQGHSGPFWYYIPAILVGFFPWSVFLGPALISLVQGIRRENPHRAGHLFLACWIGVFLLAWSIPRTKLPHYVLTVYPGLGLMTGWFLEQWMTRPECLGRVWMRVAIGSLAAVGVGLAIGFPILARIFTPGEELLGLLGLVLVVGAWAFWTWAQEGRRRQAGIGFAGMAVAFLVGIFGIGAVRIDRFQEAQPFIAQLNHLADDEFQLAGYQFIRESFVFYADRPIPYLEKPEQVDQFLRNSPRPFLLSTHKQEAALREQFADRLQVVARRPRFLRRGEILLWGPVEPQALSISTRPASSSER